jgi:hypothetical protein
MSTAELWPAETDNLSKELGGCSGPSFFALGLRATVLVRDIAALRIVFCAL